MKRLTIEDRVERLEDRILGRLCWSCLRELERDENGSNCNRCSRGYLEEDEQDE